MSQTNYVQPLQEIRGGYKTYAQYSGVVTSGGVQIWSGQGRLNSVILQAIGAAGLIAASTATIFYDAVAGISGGPLPTSGHVPLYTIPAQTSGFTALGIVNNPDVPFFSGLCYSPASGQLGFTVTFTPEKSVV
jgi:hypothetical protein